MFSTLGGDLHNHHRSLKQVRSGHFNGIKKFSTTNIGIRKPLVPYWSKLSNKKTRTDLPTLMKFDGAPSTLPKRKTLSPSNAPNPSAVSWLRLLSPESSHIPRSWHCSVVFPSSIPCIFKAWLIILSFLGNGRLLLRSLRLQSPAGHQKTVFSVA